MQKQEFERDSIHFFRDRLVFIKETIADRDNESRAMIPLPRNGHAAIVIDEKNDLFNVCRDCIGNLSAARCPAQRAFERFQLPVRFD
ncbi:MAG TPA: hypothetical protein VIW80_18170 [Pyrinomonadaceae bacterium]